MKYLLTILLTLTICCPAWAGQLVINTLPYNISQSQHTGDTWDTVTLNGNRQVSSTNGIVFVPPASYWLILLGTDTLDFGTTTTAKGSVGINMGSGVGGSHDITVKGGYIRHRPANIADGYDGPFVATDTLNSNNMCVNMGYGAYNILLDSVREMRVKGYRSHVVAGGARMLRARHSRFFNDCYAYFSRELFEATCIKASGSHASLADGQYHWRIDSCYLYDKAHAAVYGAGTSASATNAIVMQFNDDTVIVDSRNRQYTTYSGTGASNTNAYGIQFTYGHSDSYIKNCVIQSGTSYSGGRGIQLVRCYGTEAAPIDITGNHIDCHEGNNVEFGTLYYGCGVKIRQGCTGVWLHDNVIVWTADTTQSLGGPAYQPKGEALMYQMEFDSGDPFTGPHYITIENNLCSTKVVTNVNDPDYELAVVDFETCQYSDTTVHVRNNNYVSAGNHIYNYGQYDGGGNYVPVWSDTVSVSSSAISPKYTFNPGDYRGANHDTAYDVYYGSGTAPTSVSHYFQGQVTSSGIQDITICKTLRIIVKGNNDLPVTNANVIVRDVYDNIRFSAPSRSNGVAIGVYPYRFYSRTETDLDLTTAYVSASKDGTTADTTFTVAWNTVDDTIYLAVAGDGVWDTGDVPLPTDTIITFVAADSVNEGDTLQFQVAISPALSYDLTFNFATADSTTEPNDYTAVSGLDTIPTGDTTVTISVPTTNDATVESNEILKLILSSFSSGVVRRYGSDSVGVGIILNNDTAAVSGRTRVRGVKR